MYYLSACKPREATQHPIGDRVMGHRTNRTRSAQSPRSGSPAGRQSSPGRPSSALAAGESRPSAFKRVALATTAGSTFAAASEKRASTGAQHELTPPRGGSPSSRRRSSASPNGRRRSRRGLSETLPPTRRRNSSRNFSKTASPGRKSNRQPGVAERLYNNAKQVSLMHRVMDFIESNAAKPGKPDSVEQKRAMQALYSGNSAGRSGGNDPPRYFEYVYGGGNRGPKLQRPNVQNQFLGVRSGYVQEIRERMHRTTGHSRRLMEEASAREAREKRMLLDDEQAAINATEAAERDAMLANKKKLGLLQSTRCAVCGVDFRLSSLPVRVSYHSIRQLRLRWKANYEAFGLPPPSGASSDALDHVPPSKLYAAQPVCRFCSQFFGVYHGESYEETGSPPKSGVIGRSEGFDAAYRNADFAENGSTGYDSGPTTPQSPGFGSSRGYAAFNGSDGGSARTRNKPYTADDLVDLLSTSSDGDAYDDDSFDDDSSRASSRSRSSSSGRSRVTHSSSASSRSRSNSSSSRSRSVSTSRSTPPRSPAKKKTSKDSTKPAAKAPAAQAGPKSTPAKKTGKPAPLVVPVGKKRVYPVRHDKAAAIAGRPSPATYLKSQNYPVTKEATLGSDTSDDDDSRAKDSDASDSDTNLSMSGASHSKSGSPKAAGKKHGMRPPSATGGAEDGEVAADTTGASESNVSERKEKKKPEREKNAWADVTRYGKRRQRYINEIAKKKKAERRREEAELMRQMVFPRNSITGASGPNNRRGSTGGGANSQPQSARLIKKPIKEQQSRVTRETLRQIPLGGDVHVLVLCAPQYTSRMPLPHATQPLLESRFVPWCREALQASRVTLLFDGADIVTSDGAPGAGINDAVARASDAQAFLLVVYVGHVTYAPKTFDDVTIHFACSTALPADDYAPAEEQQGQPSTSSPSTPAKHKSPASNNLAAPTANDGYGDDDDFEDDSDEEEPPKPMVTKVPAAVSPRATTSSSTAASRANNKPRTPVGTGEDVAVLLRSLPFFDPQCGIPCAVLLDGGFGPVTAKAPQATSTILITPSGDGSAENTGCPGSFLDAFMCEWNEIVRIGDEQPQQEAGGGKPDRQDTDRPKPKGFAAILSELVSRGVAGASGKPLFTRKPRDSNGDSGEVTKSSFVTKVAACDGAGYDERFALPANNAFKAYPRAMSDADLTARYSLATMDLSKLQIRVDGDESDGKSDQQKKPMALSCDFATDMSLDMPHKKKDGDEGADNDDEPVAIPPIAVVLQCANPGVFGSNAFAEMERSLNKVARTTTINAVSTFSGPMLVMYPASVDDDISLVNALNVGRLREVGGMPIRAAGRVSAIACPDGVTPAWGLTRSDEPTIVDILSGDE